MRVAMRTSLRMMLMEARDGVPGGLGEALCSLLAAGVYANTLGADFCYDDSRAITSNQDLRPDVPWTRVFYDDFWGTPLSHSGSHKSFRPLCTLSFRLNFALGGLEPWGYHLANVLLHAACTAVYTRLTCTLLPPLPWGILAGLLFAVHPVHTEAVAGVVGRADVGAGLFFLLSLLAYARYCRARDAQPDGEHHHHHNDHHDHHQHHQQHHNNQRHHRTNGVPLPPTGCRDRSPVTEAGTQDGAVPCRERHTNGNAHGSHGNHAGAGLVGGGGGGGGGGSLRRRRRWWRWAWLGCSVLCAVSSMLWKEQGVTVLAVCAVYDVLVHSRLALGELLPLLHKRGYGAQREGLLALTLGSVLLLGLRLRWMCGGPPSFSGSDNPAADSPDTLTRALTFHYLPAANVALLLCPATLSFDWSMDAVPLVRSLRDPRNVATGLLYLGLAAFLWCILRGLRHRKRAHRDGQPLLHKSKTNGASCSEHGGGSANGGAPPPPSPPPPPPPPPSPPPLTTAAVKNGGRKSNGAAGPEGRRAPRPRSERTLNAAIASLAMLVLPFVPATNLFFYVGFVMAERVLYIPSMGYCLLVAAGARALANAGGAASSSSSSSSAAGAGAPSPGCGRRRRRLRRVLLGAVTGGLLAVHAARTVHRNRDWASEEALYRAGIATNPAKAWGNLGNVLKSQGKVAEAEHAYRNALHHRGNMADMLYNLGLLLQEENRLNEALYYYKLAIGARPTLASAYLNTGIVLVSQGKASEAQIVFRACADIPDERLKDPQAHMTSVASCLYNLGKVLHEQDLHQEAIEVFNEALKKMPRQFGPQSLYNMMGEAHTRLGRLAEAERWYQESLLSKPDHVPAHLTYAKLLSATNRKVEAERLFLKAIDLDPAKANTYMHYAQFLVEQSRFLEAAGVAEKASQQDSTDFETVFSTAHMCRQAGLNHAAEKYYRQAAQLRPNHSTALMNLGAILHLNGLLEEAENHYLRALRLKPDDSITHSNLQKLRKIMEKQGRPGVVHGGHK
ncbi:protein O-mannosyl-transferase TMTC2 [Petromyzon marinus]|uniref:protein O-mannosyl-transferase TMTC2 n=1 Tax=Petromyzon marinus TaxID=7757 RepID=UPI003F6F0BF7